MVTEESMADRQFLAPALEAAALGFEEFDLGDDSALEECEGVLASFVEGGHLAADGRELATTVGDIQVGGLDFFKGLESGASIESGGFIGFRAADANSGKAARVVNRNVEAWPDGSDPLPKSGRQGGALTGGAGAEGERRK
jgi:hypothetical protein